MFTRSLQTAYQTLLQSALTLKDAWIANPNLATNTVARTLIFAIFGLVDPWLSRGIEAAAVMYGDEILKIGHEFVEHRRIMVGVFVAVLACLSVLLYHPLVLSLDFQFKRVRGLLVLVPLSWITENRDLAQLIKDQA